MIRSLLYGVFITVVILFISFIYVLKKALSREIFDVFFSLDKRFFFFSLLSMLFYHTFDNLRLFILSRAMNLRYSFLYGYVVSFINTFGATITPAHVGGEMMSLYLLSRKGARLHKVISIVTMKTLTGMAFFTFLTPLLAYHFYKSQETAIKLLAILLVLSALTFGFYRVGRIFFDRSKKEKSLSLMIRVKYTFKRFLVVTKLFLRDKKRHLFFATVSSLLLYISFLSSGAFLIKAFEQSVSFQKAVFVQITLIYAIFLSPTPGGSGVGEIGGLEVFSGILPLSVLGTFVILWRLITQYLSAMIGGVFFFILLFRDSKDYLFKVI